MSYQEIAHQPSNRLPVLAAEIRRAHAEAQEAARTAAERAIEAGQALLEAKALVKHGEWLLFLAEASVPKRTAQRYMALAESDLRSDTVTLLGGIAAALRFLSLRTRAVAALDKAVDHARQEGADAAAGSIVQACDLMTEMAEMLGDDASASVSAGFNRWLVPMPEPCAPAGTGAPIFNFRAAAGYPPINHLIVHTVPVTCTKKPSAHTPSKAPSKHRSMSTPAAEDDGAFRSRQAAGSRKVNAP